ncbi:MAG: hypothetical protein IJ564_03855 [Alphaproteobacteria bacterium]|nr:hypothetical protein [Alphaproteobacteria bacterium]
MFEFQTYLSDVKAKKLAIYLHGYNDSVQNCAAIAECFEKYLQNAVLVVPQSPQKCDKNKNNMQWFGMLDVDAQNRRRNPEISAEEIFNIYENAGKSVSDCAKRINEFISQMQTKFGIDDAHTYLIGFSQGAMLTVFTALSRKKQLAGAFCLSGMIAAKNVLEKEICAKPKVYLFHGEDDLKVQYKTLDITISWLQNHGISPYIRRIKNLPHKVTEEEILQVCRIINAD